MAIEGAWVRAVKKYTNLVQVQAVLMNVQGGVERKVVSQFEYWTTRTPSEMRNDTKERRTHLIEMVVMQ